MMKHLHFSTLYFRPNYYVWKEPVILKIITNENASLDVQRK